MLAWNPQANDIFLAALELHSRDQRLAYFDQACDGALGPGHSSQIHNQVSQGANFNQRASHGCPGDF
jgi:hypothetical protein